MQRLLYTRSEAAQMCGMMIFRRRAGISQEDLGFLSALHRTEIGQLERGIRIPRIDTLIKLAGALQLPPGDLLKGMERHTGEAFARAKLLSGARHRADIAMRHQSGELHAIEVELTPKAPRRLEEIIRAWRRFRGVDLVVYFAREGKTYRGVKRAIERVEAQESVLLRRLEEAL